MTNAADGVGEGGRRVNETGVLGRANGLASPVANPA